MASLLDACGRGDRFRLTGCCRGGGSELSSGALSHLRASFMISSFPSLRATGAPTAALPGVEAEEGAPRRFQVSHSQLEAYRLCPRKWWLRWVAKVKEPQRTSLILGDRLHALAEGILRRLGTPMDWAHGLELPQQEWCQRAALFAQQRGFWAPDPLAWVEYPFVLLIGEQHRQRDGIPLAGTAVVQDPQAGQSVRKILPPPEGGQDPYLVGFIDQLLMGPEYASVADHKSAKNRRYGKKKRDVVEGDQLPTYACIPLQRYPHLKQIEGVYNVFLKEAEPSEDIGYQVRDQIPREVAVEKWSGIIRDTQAMQTLRQQVPKVGKDIKRAQNWKQVPGAVDLFRGQTKEIAARCNAFGAGGCFAKDACFGYCSMERVVQRLDTPSPPPPASSSSPPSNPNPFGSLRDQSPKKGPPMPFGIKPTPSSLLVIPSVGAHCYVPDPETGVQYRGTILTITGQPPEHRILLWPEAGQEPNPDQSTGYICPVGFTAEQIAMLPKEGVPLQGYAEALRLIGQPVPTWAPKISEQALGRAQRAQPGVGPSIGPAEWHHLVGAIGSVVKVSLSTVDATYERELTAVKDEGLRLKGIMAPITWDSIKDVVVIGTTSEVAARAQAAAAAAAAPAPTAQNPTPSAQPAPAPTGMHPSEDSPAVPEVHAQVAAASSPILAMQQQQGMSLKGKVAHVQILGEPVSHRLTVLDAAPQGLSLEGRAEPVPWDRIAELKAAEEVARPGDKADAKRVEKVMEEKELLASGSTALAQKVADIVRAALALEQPRMGKKELLKLQVVVEALNKSLGQGGIAAAVSTSAEGAPVPNADALTKAAMEGNRQGWTQALDEAIKALQALNRH